MKTLNLLALVLIIVGGLNWLLVGLFKWDLVGGIFGGMDSVFARIVYILVGLAAIYSFKLLSKVSK
ncbi:DUF378 domain-containing protein [Gottfriedia acidiceleris]|uniref:DUF378 domain-containing protein n=1 Tax=Gottfriedia acidiceleris TaxID=371036 RepID=A0ABY4JR79_9BACI|nr:DUF378 domain-containing protein [Gottfriedia acidiceleris]UPM56355.1 DUF378 domain-containing protein [Gottfriedia acidiceleris]